MLVALPFIISFKSQVVSANQQTASSEPEEKTRQFVITSIDNLLNLFQKSLQANSNKNKLLTYYRLARKEYKHIEFFVEYYSVLDAKYYINGALVPKYDIEFGKKFIAPQGFQVIEEHLFKADADFIKIEAEYKLLVEKFTKLKNYYTTLSIKKNKLAEATQLQLPRLMSLNLNGYDCTINKENITETIFVFEGLKTVLSFFDEKSLPEKKVSYKTLLKYIDKCISNLNTNKNADTFDRLNFITKFANPTYVYLQQFFNSLAIKPSQVNYALPLYANLPYTFSSIKNSFFALYSTDTTNLKLQAYLGEILFFDPILSGNNKRACASCHQPNLAFTDGLNRSYAYNNKNKILRNSPTLLNASFQRLYFHDGRLFNLEEQAGEVFHNDFEMNSNAKEIVEKLNSSYEYKYLFREAFKGSLDSSITFFGVMKAIAEYVRTLTTNQSRFDKYIQGDSTQLIADEKKGYTIFAGKALCGSCHFYPIFNGTVPPLYNDNEFEVLGVPETTEHFNIDSDIGREAVTKMEIHKYAFKTPGIRNIQYTAPYMHNGVYKTLDEVLTFYNKGGGNGFKFNIPNQTLPFDSLNLSATELNQLKLFLFCLADTVTKVKQPKTLPKFNSTLLNSRKIGGEY